MNFRNFYCSFLSVFFAISLFCASLYLLVVMSLHIFKYAKLKQEEIVLISIVCHHAKGVKSCYVKYENSTIGPNYNSPLLCDLKISLTASCEKCYTVNRCVFSHSYDIFTNPTTSCSTCENKIKNDWDMRLNYGIMIPTMIILIILEVVTCCYCCNVDDSSKKYHNDDYELVNNKN